MTWGDLPRKGTQIGKEGKIAGNDMYPSICRLIECATGVIRKKSYQALSWCNFISRTRQNFGNRFFFFLFFFVLVSLILILTPSCYLARDADESAMGKHKRRRLANGNFLSAVDQYL